MNKKCTAGVLAGLLVSLWGLTAQAATFNVTKFADTADGTCDADCSVREAIIAANANPGSDTVIIPSGNFILGDPSGGATGALVINGDVTIEGNGDFSAPTIIDGFGPRTGDRVFHILTGDVTIDFLTIQDGNAGSSSGGGILKEGSGALTLTNSIVIGNQAAHGGGIAVNGGQLWMDNSTIRGNAASVNGGGLSTEVVAHITNSFINQNTAQTSGGGIFMEAGPGTLAISHCHVTSNTAQRGGGIYLAGGNLSLDNSQVEFNTAQGDGGGIFDDGAGATISSTSITNNIATTDGNGGGIANFAGAGSMTLVNTFVGTNRADGSGGGVWNAGNLVLTNDTIMDNLADANAGGASGGDGGGLFNQGTTTFKNTIIAGSEDRSPGHEAPDCFSDSSSGHSLTASGPDIVQNLSGCEVGGGAASVMALDPLVSGGRLTPSSPAIDAGTDDGCPATDLDGFVRPFGPHCDIGADEFGATALPPKVFFPHSPITKFKNPALNQIGDFLSLCGNGKIESGEQCDDGNKANGDGCNSACKSEFCGDGIVQAALGEQCDGGFGCNNACKKVAVKNIPSAKRPWYQTIFGF